MITLTRGLFAGVAGGALLGAVVGVLPPATAYAAPEAPSGPYQATIDTGDGEFITETWTFDPCGSDCAVVNGVTPHNWKFHLSNGRWTSSGPTESVCPLDASPGPATVNASFDAATLTGEYRITVLAECGELPAGPLNLRPFQLAKLG